jgi:membrane AbrB-like protein
LNLNRLSFASTIIFVFVSGYLGYLLFKRIKMPAPGLTGSLAANAIAASLGIEFEVIPIQVNFLLQALIGIIVGSQFNREKIKQIKSLALASSLVGLWMAIVGLGLGYLIYRFTDMDIGTALFSAVPGGMSEMSALAIMYKLNVPIVVVFQFLRIVMVYFSVPLMAKLSSRQPAALKSDVIEDSTNSGLEECKYHHIIFTILLGIIAGYLAWKIEVPGGAIVGSLIAVGGCKSYGIRLKSLPKNYIVLIQICLGASLGLTFTPEVAGTLTDMAGISVIFSVLIVLNGIILGFAIHKLFKIDLITSLLACAAAGVSQMSAIALDMDADAVVVSVIQSIRLVAIVLILQPVIIYIM